MLSHGSVAGAEAIFGWPRKAVRWGRRGRWPNAGGRPRGRFPL